MGWTERSGRPGALTVFGATPCTGRQHSHPVAHQCTRLYLSQRTAVTSAANWPLARCELPQTPLVVSRGGLRQEREGTGMCPCVEGMLECSPNPDPNPLP
jgi:hypothetical protein